LVGTVFLVAACLHWRLCVERPTTLPVWCRSVRFVRPNPVFSLMATRYCI
jgi:hypothetical protein